MLILPQNGNCDNCQKLRVAILKCQNIEWHKENWQNLEWQKQNFPFQELLFLHKNNTMSILLKIASVRVSSIQIMQVRVQNKGKRFWKSRYDGDVSTPPSLNLCLSSSNSVDKLKVIKKKLLQTLFALVVVNM